jgi:hypothetical protein
MEASHQFWNDVVQWSKNLDFLDRMLIIIPKCGECLSMEKSSEEWCPE